MCEIGLLLSAASTGLSLVQQQQQASAANRIQRQRAELQRQQLIADYDAQQRGYFRKRAAASEKKAESALKALIQRERARTRAGAQGKAQTSRSVQQAINAISAVEGREAQRLDQGLKDASVDLRAQNESAERAAAARALNNTSDPGPDFLGAALGFAKSNSSKINGVLSGLGG